MPTIMTMLLQAAALPMMWAEPVQPGRALTANDAVGLCATAEGAAVTEADALLRSGRDGGCGPISGTWRVTRSIKDRCLGMEMGWYLDQRGRRHPATSCSVEGHVVEIRQGGAVRLALVAMTAEQLD